MIELFFNYSLWSTKHFNHRKLLQSLIGHITKCWSTYMLLFLSVVPRVLSHWSSTVTRNDVARESAVQRTLFLSVFQGLQLMLDAFMEWPRVELCSSGGRRELARWSILSASSSIVVAHCGMKASCTCAAALASRSPEIQHSLSNFESYLKTALFEYQHRGRRGKIVKKVQ